MSETCPDCRRRRALSRHVRHGDTFLRYCRWSDTGQCTLTGPVALARHLATRATPPSDADLDLPTAAEIQAAGRYVRATYGLTCQVGDPVLFQGRPGRISGFRGAYVLARLDDQPGTVHLHPTWRVEYPAPVNA